MTQKKLIRAIEKELKKPATNTHHAIFKKMLRSDLRHGDFDSEQVKAVKEKYGI